MGQVGSFILVIEGCVEVHGVAAEGPYRREPSLSSGSPEGLWTGQGNGSNVWDRVGGIGGGRKE